MNDLFEHNPNHLSSHGIAWLASSAIGPRIAFAPETGAGSGEAGPSDGGADKKADETKDPADKPKPSDEEARLLREVMAGKEKQRKLAADLKDASDRLKLFEGMDPKEMKELLSEREKAAAERAAAEKKALEDKGNWDRLKQMMIDEHGNEKQVLTKEIDELTAKLNAATQSISNLTIGNAFGSSKFVADDLLLPVSKARAVYGAHFEIENDAIVAYNKPRGAADRSKLVDAKGNDLDFDSALRKIIDADADRDSLLRSKIAEGANSQTINKKPNAKEEIGTGQHRIAAALAATLAKGK